MWHIILHLAACQTRLRLWLGDIDGAERWARTEQDVISQDLPIDLPTYLQEVRSLSVARVFLARCEVDKALETLASVLAGAESAGRMAHVIEANLLAALTLQTEGRTGEALDALERSLALGAPAGYVRLYLEAGKPLLLLLPKLRTHVLTQGSGGQSVDTDCLLQRIDQLLAAFDGPVLWTDLPTIEKQPIIDGLLEPLTPRELEVLQLVCQGLSNRTIAEHLSVTLNTVKKHSSNI
jgi:LuxR family maltose regulon positive regulatory protein